MAKSAYETVRKSEQKRGIQSTSVKLTPEEKALWDEMSALHGGRKPSLIKALELLKGRNDLTKSEVLDWIERHT